MIKYILLDLDNTIYPASAGVAQELSRLINLYTARHLGVSEEDALPLRRRKFHEYGTTLKWLQKEHGLTDFEDFFEKVHPPRVGDFLQPDPRVRQALESISVPMAIFTNGPEEHARRVTDFYGITSLFTRFYDIRFHELNGKPNRSSYERVLQSLGMPAEELLLVDDQGLYLTGFKELGGQVLLIREQEPEVGCDETQDRQFPRIKHISELPEYLAGQKG